MCGIAGLVSVAPIDADRLARVRAMNAAQRHRGPDGDGEYVDGHVVLAMRRLSIIDLAGGWQPFYSEDRSVVAVANGEIYNFVELRARLTAAGHRFVTANDCETIVHLYEDLGLACVDSLRGMFAFAVWDTNKRRLLLARDRMGEKPLYLYETDGQLVFASEMKGLLRSGLVPFELDPYAVNLYFHFQYVPEPATPLKAVRKLDAGCELLVEVEPWTTTEKRYWSMENAPPIEGEPAKLVREQLEEVTELVLRADVPVGLALSGGLDSSAIAALAAPRYRGTMQAFSVGYRGRPHNDERQEARALADSLGIEFHEIEVSASEVVDFFPELVYWRDDPIGDISGHGYYAVMKLASERGVPVVLQGQGGDELFWGYPWVRQAALRSGRKARLHENGWRALPDYIRSTPSNGFSPSSPSTWPRAIGAVWRGWMRFCEDWGADPECLVFLDIVPDFRFAAREARGLYGRALTEAFPGMDPCRPFRRTKPWPPVEVALTNLICSTYLRENGITQGDRLAMASSVELRLPLVDHRLVETVIGLRRTFSDLGAPPKAWLKAALSDLLSPELVSRPKKGFAPPVLEWHRALFAAYGSSLRDGHLAGAEVLSRGACLELSAGPFPPGLVTPLSFKALVLEQWCRRLYATLPAPGQRPAAS